jgi:hypothetical protein
MLYATEGFAWVSASWNLFWDIKELYCFVTLNTSSLAFLVLSSKINWQSILRVLKESSILH